MCLNSSPPNPVCEIEEQLTRIYGPLIQGNDLVKVLGYQSREALRQAAKRKTLPVRLITIENRRGKFALARDVAVFLAKIRMRDLID